MLICQVRSNSVPVHGHQTGNQEDQINSQTAFHKYETDWDIWIIAFITWTSPPLLTCSIRICPPCLKSLHRTLVLLFFCFFLFSTIVHFWAKVRHVLNPLQSYCLFKKKKKKPPPHLVQLSCTHRTDFCSMCFARVILSVLLGRRENAQIWTN